MGGGGLWAGFGRGLWRVRSRVACLLVFGWANRMSDDFVRDARGAGVVENTI